MADQETPQEDSQVRAFELRVEQSRYTELRLQNDAGLFLFGKGTHASTERWYCDTPEGYYFGDGVEEIIVLAEGFYPDLRSWLPQFDER